MYLNLTSYYALLSSSSTSIKHSLLYSIFNPYIYRPPEIRELKLGVEVIDVKFETSQTGTHVSKFN